MWHTDFKQLADGRRFVGYEDGASRRLPSHGVFDGAATANAPAVPHAAIPSTAARPRLWPTTARSSLQTRPRGAGVWRRHSRRSRSASSSPPPPPPPPPLHPPARCGARARSRAAPRRRAGCRKAHAGQGRGPAPSGIAGGKNLRLHGARKRPHGAAISAADAGAPPRAARGAEGVWRRGACSA